MKDYEKAEEKSFEKAGEKVLRFQEIKKKNFNHLFVTFFTNFLFKFFLFQARPVQGIAESSERKNCG